MRSIIKGLFFSIILFSSCSVGNVEKIAFEDFGEPVPLTRSEKAVRGFMSVDEFFVVDSLLVIENSRSDSIFMVYGLGSLDLLYSWGTIGRSANEYTMPKLIKDDNNLIIADFNSQKMEWWEPSRHLLTGKKDMRSEDMPQSIVNAGDDLFVYDRIRPNELDLFTWKPGEKPSKIFDFEYLRQRYNNTGVYLGFLGVNAKRSRIIYAYQYINGFDILDMKGNILKMIRKEEGGEPVLNGNSIDYLQSKTYCFGIRTRDESFFLYYVGYSGSELVSDPNRVTYIEEYDWEGKPLHIYSLPSFVSGFDIISDNAVICQDNYSENEPMVIFERVK